MNSEIKTPPFELSHWLAICGMFFMNRVAAAFLIISVFILYIRRGGLYYSKVVAPFISVCILQLILIAALEYDVSKCIQQIFLISIFLLTYEQIFLSAPKKKSSLFYKYIEATYYVALFGLFQELIYILFRVNICEYLIGNHLTQLTTNYLIRITSTLSEGGCLGTILIPSTIYLFYYNDPQKILGRKKYFILTAALLTFSPFVYLSLLLIPSIKLYKNTRTFKYIVGSVFILLSIFIFQLVLNKETGKESGGTDGIIMRISDTWNLVHEIVKNDFYSLSQYNTSTGVLGKSLYIGFNAPSRIVGTGLGTFEQNHKLVASRILTGKEPFADLNVEDGYSLLTRILTEWGYLGIVLYICFLFYFYNKNNYINVSVFFVLLCFFIRGGSYVDWGTVFWHFLYVYTSRYTISNRDKYKRLLSLAIVKRIIKTKAVKYVDNDNYSHL